MAQNEETKLQNNILLALGRDPAVSAMRQHVGEYRALRSDHIISIGDIGMSDIGLIVAVEITPDMVGKTIGAYVAIEVKTPTGRQSPAQKLWQKNVERRGAIYRLARSVDDAIKIVDDAKKGVLFTK